MPLGISGVEISLFTRRFHNILMQSKGKVSQVSAFNVANEEIMTTGRKEETTNKVEFHEEPS
jgi:anthranilate/para-aminobenzoate synthase component II